MTLRWLERIEKSAKADRDYSPSMARSVIIFNELKVGIYFAFK